MHGDSLLTCIKNVFNPKIKGESFGARSTPTNFKVLNHIKITILPPVKIGLEDGNRTSSHSSNGSPTSSSNGSIDHNSSNGSLDHNSSSNSSHLYAIYVSKSVTNPIVVPRKAEITVINCILRKPHTDLKTQKPQRKFLTL